MIARCYQSFEQKARLYPALTIPAIVAQAANSAIDKRQEPVIAAWLATAQPRLAFRPLPNGVISPDGLRVLHELVRRFKYEAVSQPCDFIYTAGDTILRGKADCDSSLVPLLAVLMRWGVPAMLVTSGDPVDHFRHVYAIAFAAGKWRAMDAKGTNTGSDFEAVTDGWPVRRLWGWHWLDDGSLEVREEVLRR